MNTPFSAKTVLPPDLDKQGIDRLSQIIKEWIQHFEKGSGDRVKRIEEIRAFHQDDYSKRAEEGTIFQYSNVAVPLMKGVATSLAAKIDDELWNNSMPFTFRPEDKADKAMLRRWQKYWEWELMREVQISEVGSAAVDTLAVEGTAITYRSWKIERSYFPKKAKVLLEDGNIVMDDNGRSVEADDVRFMEGQRPEPNLLQRLMGIQPDAPEQMFFKDRLKFSQPLDGTTVDYGRHKFEEREIRDFVEHRNNAEIKLIPFEDFICDITAATIEESALVGHKYELRLWQLNEMAKTCIGDGKWAADNLKTCIEANVKSASEQGGDTVASHDIRPAMQRAPIEHLGEMCAELDGIIQTVPSYKTASLSTVFLKYDIDGDGTPEDLVCIFDLANHNVIWYDYLVNQYADCRLPYDVHGLYRIPGRWWSVGPYDALKVAGEYVDMVFNRMNYRTGMNANPLGWIKPDMFIKQPEEWVPGARAILKQEANPADAFGFYQMPANEAMEWQFFQFFVSMVQLVTGITNAAQGDVANLPSTSTATGTASIIAEGNKLYRKLIVRIYRSMRSMIFGLVRLIQQNLDSKRVYRYQQGDETVIDTVTPQEIREMRFDIDVEINKLEPTQRVQTAQTAMQMVQAFMAAPPEYQVRLRDMFVRVLEALGFVDADDMIPSVEEIAQDQQKDAIIMQVNQKISEAAAKITMANADPTKQIAQDLLGASQMLAALAARPPEEQTAPDGAVPVFAPGSGPTEGGPAQSPQAQVA